MMNSSASEKTSSTGANTASQGKGNDDFGKRLAVHGFVNAQSRAFGQLTGLRRLRVSFRRKLGETEQNRILFLIELANRELDLFFKTEAAKKN